MPDGLEEEVAVFKRGFAAIVVAITMAFTALAPAHADLAPPPKPTWAGSFDMRIGQWVPCLEGWSTTDCIESVQLRLETDTAWTDLTFVPDPLFVPESATQVWDLAGNDKVQNYAHFEQRSSGHWQIPNTTLLTNGGDRLNVATAFMHNALQVNVMPSDNKWSMREDSYLRVTLQTKTAQKYIQWTYSNTHDPTVAIPDAEHVVFTTKPTVNVHPIGGSGVCFGESTDFKSAFEGVDAIMNALIPDDVANNEPPAEVVFGTNGFWCFNGMQWNADAGQLVIKVGTVHWDSKGQALQGWLEAKIRGALVRKWWGVNPKLVAGSARVEVVYENGEIVTATTNASYDAKNDWIDLRSYGFHYSSPVVGIKVVKTEANAEAPAVMAPAKTKPAKTMTCTKGKTTKKVSGTKCPTGWKKK